MNVAEVRFSPPDSRAQSAIGSSDDQTDPGEVQPLDRFLGSVPLLSSTIVRCRSCERLRTSNRSIRSGCCALPDTSEQLHRRFPVGGPYAVFRRRPSAWCRSGCGPRPEQKLDAARTSMGSAMRLRRWRRDLEPPAIRPVRGSSRGDEAGAMAFTVMPSCRPRRQRAGESTNEPCAL